MIRSTGLQEVSHQEYVAKVSSRFLVGTLSNPTTH